MSFPANRAYQIIGKIVVCAMVLAVLFTFLVWVFRGVR